MADSDPHANSSAGALSGKDLGRLDQRIRQLLQEKNLILTDDGPWTSVKTPEGRFIALLQYILTGSEENPVLMFVKLTNDPLIKEIVEDSARELFGIKLEPQEASAQTRRLFGVDLSYDILSLYNQR